MSRPRSLLQHGRRSLALLIGAALAVVAISAVGADTRDISFSDLAFPLREPVQIQAEGDAYPRPAYGDQIPDAIRELDESRIRIGGFMMPTALEGNGVREFILVTSPLVCCYGQTPEANQYVVVRVEGPAAPLLENIPLEFEGTLKVADIYQDGFWVGMYELICDSVKPAQS